MYELIPATCRMFWYFKKTKKLSILKQEDLYSEVCTFRPYLDLPAGTSRLFKVCYKCVQSTGCDLTHLNFFHVIVKKKSVQLNPSLYDDIVHLNGAEQI